MSISDARVEWGNLCTPGSPRCQRVVAHRKDILTSYVVRRIPCHRTTTAFAEQEDTMGRFTKFPREGPSFSLRNVSRRQFVGISAGAAGGVLGSGLWTPALGDHDDDERRREAAQCPEQQPIPHINMAEPGPHTFGSFHFFFPGP